jgi:hypothetical protein
MFQYYLHVPPVQSILHPLTILILKQAADYRVEVLSVEEIVLDSPIFDAGEKMSKL